MVLIASDARKVWFPDGLATQITRRRSGVRFSFGDAPRTAGVPPIEARQDTAHVFGSRQHVKTVASG